MTDIRIWADDRNLNVQEAEEDRNLFMVAEHNDLITKARHDLNTQELKILDYVISKIKPTDDNFTTINTSMYKISRILNVKRSGMAYSNIASNLNDMRKKDVFIYNEAEHSITMAGWFDYAKVWENGQVELRINADLSPYLLKLKNAGHYTSHYLVDTLSLKSKYSILLYKLMREADKDGGKSLTVVSGSPDDFKKWMGAPANYTYGRLKDKILKPAIDEINLKITDMRLDLAQARHGRKVTNIEIRNYFFAGEIHQTLAERQAQVQDSQTSDLASEEDHQNSSPQPDALSDEELAKLQKQLNEEIARRNQKSHARDQRLAEQDIKETAPYDYERDMHGDAIIKQDLASTHRNYPAELSFNTGDFVRLSKDAILHDTRRNDVPLSVTDNLVVAKAFKNGNVRLHVADEKWRQNGETVYAKAELLIPFTEDTHG